MSLASMGLASAFVESPRTVIGPTGRSALRASDPRRDDKFVTTEIRDVRDVVSGDSLDTRVPSPSGFANDTPMPMADGSAKRQAPRTSQALPFTTCPAALDGTLAGDVGFDPLGFADSPDNLSSYREAEVKHGRLAMLAAAGWPLSELWNTKIARALEMVPTLNPDGRAPSVLNGGMGGISLAYWLGCVALAAALDVYGSYFATKKSGYIAGDLGFDPLGFYPRGAGARDKQGRDRLQLAEIKHGRLAMVAITAFAAQEFVAHIPVVDQTPLFFHPITDVLMDQVPSYYIPPESVSEVASGVVPAATTVTEAFSSAVEAASVAPEIAVPAVESASEAASSAAVEATVVTPEAIVPTAVEATAVVTPNAVTESISVVPVDTAAAEELAAAKTRIVELESKLAQIDALIR